MWCERRVTRQYVSWAIADKASKEHYLQYLTRVIYGTFSLDFSLLFKFSIAQIAWSLNLVWSVPIASILTQAMCIVARVPMLIQIASTKDLRPKSTRILALLTYFDDDIQLMTSFKVVVRSKFVFSLGSTSSPQSFWLFEK